LGFVWLISGKRSTNITIESIDSEKLDEEAFKRVGIENFLKDDDEADCMSLEFELSDIVIVCNY